MQRELERRGIPTASVSVARDVSEAVKPPRALFLPFPMGHHFGPPHHVELQRRVVLETLGLLESVEVSGAIVDFDTSWAVARREAKELASPGDRRA